MAGFLSAAVALSGGCTPKNSNEPEWASDPGIEDTTSGEIVVRRPIQWRIRVPDGWDADGPNVHGMVALSHRAGLGIVLAGAFESDGTLEADLDVFRQGSDKRFRDLRDHVRGTDRLASLPALSDTYTTTDRSLGVDVRHRYIMAKVGDSYTFVFACTGREDTFDEATVACDAILAGLHIGRR